MRNKRRDFLKHTALTGISIAGGNILKGFATADYTREKFIFTNSNTAEVESKNFDENNVSIIGLYGAWAAALTESELPSFSFRKKEWSNLETWRKAATQRVGERLAIPSIGNTPKVNVNNQYDY